MPFTFSHPALVLPASRLSKQIFSMTGLIIGSMTPDFEYFIRMNVGSVYSHTLEGLFHFDLPLGIVLCFIFHDIVRNDLINNLPVKLQERFYVLKNFNWNDHFRKKWPFILLSIVVGAASHILWNSFTHPYGYFVLKLPILNARIHLPGFKITVYNFSQNISSVIGLALVLFFVYRIPKTKIDRNQSDSLYWISITLITSVIMALRIILGLSLVKYGNVIVSIMSAFFISIIVVPTLLKIKLKQKDK